MKQLLVILTVSLISLNSQANAIHIFGGFQGQPFSGDSSGVTLGAKYFFYEGRDHGTIDAYIGGLGLSTGPKQSALASLTWMAFVIQSSVSLGVDIYYPIYKKYEDQGGTLGVSLNYPL